MVIDDGILEPAVEATRRALRRLDADQIPAELQRIARYQDRRLPPPLRSRLVAALDAMPWLRDRARDELDADGGDPTGQAALLFLDRPPGWEAELRHLEQLRAAEAEADSEAREAAAADRLRSRLAKTEELLAAARDEAEMLRRAAAADAAQAAERWEKRAVRAERRAAAAAAAATTAQQQVEELEVRQVRAAAEAEQLLHRLRAERKRRAQAEARAAGKATGAEALRGSTLARHLDALTRTGAAVPPIRPAPAQPAPPPPTLPAGVRPDEAAAVGALVDHREPWRLIVDGYNAAFLLDGGPLAELRRRLLEGLARLRRQAGRELELTVVWDAATGEARTRRRGDIGEVFVSDTSADDAIVEMATGSTLPVVVATNDRELQARVNAAGGAVIWARAVVDWIAAT